MVIVMKKFVPDKWVIIEIDGKERLFSGWNQTENREEHWMMSAGIKTVKDDGDKFIIKTVNNESFKCFKNDNGLNAIMVHVFDSIISKSKPDTSVINIMLDAIDKYS